MDLGITGRVALVTGASKGIGRAIAAELVAEGAKVAIARSRSHDAAAAEIGAIGFAWDSDDLDGAGRLLRDVESRLGGPIEILVTNTGGPPAGESSLTFPREQWEAAYRSLVLAPMALIERAVPAMRRAGWGRILNVVSTTVREPVPNLMLSNAHRAAMLAAFKTVSTEVAADGVTLNSILPGRIDTERLGRALRLAGGGRRGRRARCPPAGSAPSRRWRAPPPSCSPTARPTSPASGSPSTAASCSRSSGSPGTRTRNLRINLPHRLSPAARCGACGLDHLFALDSTLGRAAYGL